MEQRLTLTQTDWERIFSLSPANGAGYFGELNATWGREWPTGWLERRREQLREEQDND